MESKKILIATKTYPSISQKYKETVCTAGVLLSEEEKPLEWVRIYPIRFRQLDFDRRYPRWSIIRALIEKNDRDYRPESFRIDDSSIEVLRKITTSNNWEERKKFLLPLQSRSIKEIKDQDKSLGIIKPRIINRYFCQQTERNWKPKQQAVLDQLDLFEPTVELEKIPYKFGYEFIDEDGDKHRFSISDWEIQELYRKCRDKSLSATQIGKEKEAIEKVRQKLEVEFMNKKDLYFIVGNLKSHKNSFMIIGVVYPPFVSQLNLF
ncbi:MAG: hypothetical protein F6K22_34645 [Okeania sp. SIO2F4]|uniref:hypothetical protein n=1 Tax=Okeania sp. SIO2F4 TaxID=2607790 RepID=UPI00142C4C9E|nr:hypothetical protein [Okeania sp. SIO2F4]NES07487.1 hypothetical protein [Okeania sp. SIO2F4]